MGHGDETCKTLVGNMRKYKQNSAPYDILYDKTRESAIDWWHDNNTKCYLEELAIKILSLIPHSSSCERSFSIFSWYFSRRRGRLLVDRVAGMAKIHTYYITNVKDGMEYYGTNMSIEEVQKLMNEAVYALDEEINEWHEEEDFEEIVNNDEADDTDLNLGSENLDIENDVQLDFEIFAYKDWVQESNENLGRLSMITNERIDEGNLNFNPSELVDNLD